MSCVCVCACVRTFICVVVVGKGKQGTDLQRLCPSAKALACCLVDPQMSDKQHCTKATMRLRERECVCVCVRWLACV